MASPFFFGVPLKAALPPLLKCSKGKVTLPNFVIQKDEQAIYIYIQTGPLMIDAGDPDVASNTSFAPRAPISEIETARGWESQKS